VEIKNFFIVSPLMRGAATPSCSQPHFVGLQKNQYRAVETVRFALITGSQPADDEFLVETFRWVKLLVSTLGQPTLV
jgi:hypothetical protein